MSGLGSLLAIFFPVVIICVLAASYITANYFSQATKNILEYGNWETPPPFRELLLTLSALISPAMFFWLRMRRFVTWIF